MTTLGVRLLVVVASVAELGGMEVACVSALSEAEHRINHLAEAARAAVFVRDADFVGVLKPVLIEVVKVFTHLETTVAIASESVPEVSVGVFTVGFVSERVRQKR